MARAIGKDDSINTCDCCGKSNLKFTVVIELDDGEIVHYGQVCAVRNTGKERKIINKEISENLKARIMAARKEFFESPEFKAMMDKQEAAPRGLFGAQCREYFREVAEAERLAEARICKKYNIKSIILP